MLAKQNKQASISSINKVKASSQRSIDRIIDLDSIFSLALVNNDYKVDIIVLNNNNIGAALSILYKKQI